MPRLEFKVLWRDSDEMLKLQVAASNGTHAAIHETYIYPQELQEFGTRLQDFPCEGAREVILESGSDDPRCHDQMCLRAFLLLPTGRSALEVKFETRGIPPASSRHLFYLTGEPAAFNRLGADLCAWETDKDAPMISEWRDA
jgi:hypothetical protein